MGELYEPYPKLPKNIRQIGERDDIVRVYVEDYVNTFLKRLFPRGGQDLRVGILLGNLEDHGGVPYVFIDGALEMEGITQEGEQVFFTEEAWKRAYQAVEEMFPKRTVQGWFLCGAPGCQLSPLNYWKQHSQYFSGQSKVMYLNSGLEGEEALYITSSDGFYKLRGHCIYYERNQMMQDYMVTRKDSRPVEAGGSDPVIRDFRRKMEQKKERAGSQNRTIQTLRGLCACLAILALAGGVAAFNSFERMQDMEAVMASVLPDADAIADVGKSNLSWLLGSPQEETKSKEEASQKFYDSNGVIIEEASGDVYPTIAYQKEKNEETLQDTAGNTSNLMMDGDSTSEKNIVPGESRQAAGEEGDISISGPITEGDGAVPEEEADKGKSEPAVGEDVSQEEESQETGEGAPDAKEAGAKPIQLEPAPGQSVYVVQEGETLYGICFQLYQNLSKVDEICEINGLDDVNVLEAGRRLIIP